LAGHMQTVTATAEDTTPPQKVTTLNAVWQGDGGRVLPGGVQLTWIAPGDSGGVGTAASYEFRYSDTPLNSFTWLSAVVIPDPPLPFPGGVSQAWFLSGPFPDPVYFALKTTDAEGNLSVISNSAQPIQTTIYLPIIIR